MFAAPKLRPLIVIDAKISSRTGEFSGHKKLAVGASKVSTPEAVPTTAATVMISDDLVTCTPPSRHATLVVDDQAAVEHIPLLSTDKVPTGRYG